MSAQSIINKTDGISCKVDSHLVCIGKRFLNIVDYDLDDKIDYKSLNKIVVFKKILEECNDVEKASVVLTKLINE